MTRPELDAIIAQALAPEHGWSPTERLALETVARFPDGLWRNAFRARLLLAMVEGFEAARARSFGGDCPDCGAKDDEPCTMERRPGFRGH